MSAESVVKVCYRHAKEETRLLCGRCERPICTRCSIPGPAGMRCRECASLRGSAIYKVSPGRLVLAAVLGLLGGLIGAKVLSVVSFFVFFIGPAYGVAIAEIVTRSSGRRVGPAILGIGVGSIVIGTLVVLGFDWAPMLSPEALKAAASAGDPVTRGAELDILLTSAIWPLIGVALAISSCYAKLKYF